MPELIRLKVGSIAPQQFAVYDEFARNIPGFQAMSERDASVFISKANLQVKIILYYHYTHNQNKRVNK